MWVMCELKLKYKVWLVSIFLCKKVTIRFPLIKNPEMYRKSVRHCRYSIPFIWSIVHIL